MKKNKVIDCDKTIDRIVEVINKMNITDIILKKLEIRNYLSKTKLSDIVDDKLIDLMYFLCLLSEYIYVDCNDDDERSRNCKIVKEMSDELVNRNYTFYTNHKYE